MSRAESPPTAQYLLGRRSPASAPSSLFGRLTPGPLGGYNGPGVAASWRRRGWRQSPSPAEWREPLKPKPSTAPVQKRPSGEGALRRGAASSARSEVSLGLDAGESAEAGGLCALPPDSPTASAGWGGLLCTSRASTAASSAEGTGEGVTVACARARARKVFDAVASQQWGGPPGGPATARRRSGARRLAGGVASRASAPERPSSTTPSRRAGGGSVLSQPGSLGRQQLRAGGDDLKVKSVESRLNIKALMAGFCDVAHRARGGHQESEVAPGIPGDPNRGPVAAATKVEAKRFAVELCSFEELVNAEGEPMALHRALDRVRPSVGGPNFRWTKVDGHGKRYGGLLDIVYDMILWYAETDVEDVSTRTCCSFSFLHREGAAYIYQPVVPIVALVISPRSSFRPMFQEDPRSFHVFKLAWRHYLDFGVSDYRAIVADKLAKWTDRCRAAIERPLEATYWLMIMVASHYHEVLVQRRVLQAYTSPPEQVPIICVDSFVSLSALLFAPERQVLFAGVNPTPSYLRWLQSIADQHSTRKGQQGESTVFETNEFLNLSVVIVFYGRIQQKVKESMPLTWVGNPTLVKGYVAKYIEENHCAAQLENAVRLYTLTCSMGTSKNCHSDAEPWHCWNGLKVCEVGVPMPCTHATFLSPFTMTRPAAIFCGAHGPDAAKRALAKSPKASQEAAPPDEAARASSSRMWRQEQRGSSVSICRSASCGSELSGLDDALHGRSIDERDEDSEAESSSSEGTSVAQSARERSFSVATDAPRHCEADAGTAEGASCPCSRYIPPALAQRPRKLKTQLPQGPQGSSRLSGRALTTEALKSLGEYDVVHGFAAVLTGGLNIAKQMLRVHFAIDPMAYGNLPSAKATWSEGVLTWYREFSRPDMHGRSRYSMLLERLVHGILGDGFTSGLSVLSLDLLRTSADKEEAHSRGAPDEAMDAAGSGSPRQRTPQGSVCGLPRRSFIPGFRRSTASAAGASPRPASPHGSVGPGSRRGHGVIAEVKLWVELYESESLLSGRSHFETFTQWCHSAHLVPFLVRCYRRAGVAGLLPHSTSGGHKHGMEASHPLVLPIMPNFCYGHCYPLYRIMQYYYGGVDTIVCSSDDPQEWETARVSLDLIPGQERINNQCWFQPREALLAQSAPGSAFTPSMLKQHEDAGDADGGRGASLAAALMAPGSSGFKRSSTIAGVLAEGPRRTPRASEVASQRSGASRRQCLGVGARPTAGRGRAAAQSPLAKPKLGRLVAADPFFWFCRHSLALCTFPAGRLARHLLGAPENLTFRYADFASRSGTPEPVREPRHPTASELGDGAPGSVHIPRRLPIRIPAGEPPPPPSICICQPTDLTGFERRHWEVRKEHVDDKQRILGDAAWWPGAAGLRFTYEARTTDVSRFHRLCVVPTPHLLYMDHTVLPAKDDARATGAEADGVPKSSSSSSSGDESQSDAVSEGGDSIYGGAGSLPHRRADESRADWLKRLRWRLADMSANHLDVPEDTHQEATREWGSPPPAKPGPAVELMLPPLLPCKAGG